MKLGRWGKVLNRMEVRKLRRWEEDGKVAERIVEVLVDEMGDR